MFNLKIILIFMLIVTEKILAEYGKVILELIENITATEQQVIDAGTQARIIRDKSNILETLQKLTLDYRKDQTGYTECENAMLAWFCDAMRNAKNNLFFAVAEDIKKALDRYNYYQNK